MQTWSNSALSIPSGITMWQPTTTFGEEKLFADGGFKTKAVISLFLIGCATTGGSSKTGAKGTTPSQICGEWKIQSLTGFENAEHFGATLSVFANEDEEFSLNGYSGVNSYFANLA